MWVITFFLIFLMKYVLLSLASKYHFCWLAEKLNIYRECGIYQLWKAWIFFSTSTKYSLNAGAISEGREHTQILAISRLGMVQTYFRHCIWNIYTWI